MWCVNYNNKTQIKVRMDKVKIAMKYAPILVYFCTTIGFIIRILVEHDVLENIYFYHDDQRYQLMRDDPAVIVFLYMLVCCVLSVLSIAVSEEDIDKYNNAVDCVFVPLLLRAMAHINDPISIIMFSIIYVAYQCDFRIWQSWIDSNVKPYKRLMMSKMQLEFFGFWLVYGLAVYFNWDVLRPGGSVAQFFCQVVMLYDWYRVKQILDNGVIDHTCNTMLLCMTRFILSVCVYVETI